jgi:hypothetical protein
VAFLAYLQSIRGPFFLIPVSSILVLLGFVASVAMNTSLLEMFVLFDQFFVNKKTFVVFFRLNWRRCSCSPFRLTGGYLGKLAEGF